jgi:hypothetical protein
LDDQIDRHHQSQSNVNQHLHLHQNQKGIGSLCTY